MNIIKLSALLFVAFAAQAQAQTAIRITKCGDATPPAGASNVYMDAQGNLCTGLGGSGTTTSTATDKSGTITLGGQSQVLLAANPARVGCEVQALGGDLWINLTTTASAGSGSFLIPAGSEYICPKPNPTTAINLFGASTGTAFTAVEYTK
jgi:hypothetical protein